MNGLSNEQVRELLPEWAKEVWDLQMQHNHFDPPNIWPLHHDEMRIRILRAWAEDIATYKGAK